MPARSAMVPGGSPAAEDDNTSWLVTFSDLVLQLFAFVLVSTVLASARRAPASGVAPDPAPAAPQVAVASAADPAADTAALAALLRQVGGGLEPPPAAAETVATSDTPALAEIAAESAAVPAPIDAPAGPVVETTRESRADAELAALAGYLSAFVRARGVEGAARVTVSGAEAVLSLNDTIGFPSGSAELRPEARPILREMRERIAAMPGLVVDVGGHTDNVPIHTAEFPSNLELSLARAARVAHELVADDPDLALRTSASGFGEHRPVASNDDPQGRAQNRRVEIRLVARDAAAG